MKGKNIKVSNLKIGDRVLFGIGSVQTTVHINSKKSDRVMVSKQPNSPYEMSIPFWSGKFDDLNNRVVMV